MAASVVYTASYRAWSSTFILIPRFSSLFNTQQSRKRSSEVTFDQARICEILCQWNHYSTRQVWGLVFWMSRLLGLSWGSDCEENRVKPVQTWQSVCGRHCCVYVWIARIWNTPRSFCYIHQSGPRVATHLGASGDSLHNSHMFISESIPLIALNVGIPPPQ